MKIAIVITLIISFFLMSCSASKHFGETLVKKPSLEETNEGVWYNYWQDQFDAFGGRVVAPSSGKYNQAAVNGYQRAMIHWENEVSSARMNTYLVILGVTLGTPILLALLAISTH